MQRKFLVFLNYLKTCLKVCNDKVIDIVNHFKTFKTYASIDLESRILWLSPANVIIFIAYFWKPFEEVSNSQMICEDSKA